MLEIKMPRSKQSRYEIKFCLFGSFADCYKNVIRKKHACTPANNKDIKRQK